MKELQVNTPSKTYPIFIGAELLKEANVYLEKQGITSDHPIFILTDENVAPFYLEKLKNVLQSKHYSVFAKVLPAGEKIKDLSFYQEVIQYMIENHMNRKTVIVALGGGTIGDLAGFCAATFMRGIRFVQIPTTILAHDSSVGGKVAVNHPLSKNLIGAFHQPECVIFDLDTLKTLPQRHIRAGLAEMIKHGLIWNQDFAQWCLTHAKKLISLEEDIIGEGIFQGCKVKAEIVAKDEKEENIRMYLNFGHTLGHAIEAVEHYAGLLHGEAIAIGMLGAAMLSKKNEIVAYIRNLLIQFELPITIPSHLSEDAIIQAMSYDKKFVGEQTTFILPKQIGEVEIVRDVPIVLVKEVIKQLREESCSLG